MSPPYVLVLGFGNTLRSDDGVGWTVADALAAQLKNSCLRILRLHQLTPEIAYDLAQSRHAVFIDADVRLAPGQWQWSQLQTATLDNTAPLRLGHHMQPEYLLALARSLGGSPLDALQLSVGPASLEMGDALSPRVAALVPILVEELTQRIQPWLLAAHAPSLDPLAPRC